MQNHNIIYRTENGYLEAEWADRAPDDDDRYAEDSIIISAKVPVTDDAAKDMKRVRTELVNKMNQWYRETRGGN